MLSILENKLIVYLCFLFSASLIVSSWYFHHKGYQEAAKEFTARIDKSNTQAETALSIKNDQVAKNQTELNAAQQTIIEKSMELKNAKNDYENLRAKYADSTQRLSVRAYCKTGGAQQDNSTSASHRPSEDVQLMPTVSTAILDFARDYNENLRMKNECIDLYNVARDACNK